MDIEKEKSCRHLLFGVCSGDSRSANLQHQSSSAIHQLDWETPYDRDNFTEPLPLEVVAAIDNSVMRVFGGNWNRVPDDRPLNILHKAGAKSW
ncbi:MAG: hypothetical protein HRT36_06880 [Alphaproteobacteria bacterium]|nr:hypothetical protein [Alphaproteobacteria bacterium]